MYGKLILFFHGFVNDNFLFKGYKRNLWQLFQKRTCIHYKLTCSNLLQCRYFKNSESTRLFLLPSIVFLYPFFKFFPEHNKVLITACHIHFVCSNNLRPFRQFLIVLFKLVVNHKKIFKRIPSFSACHVYHMDNEPCTLYMPQELMPKTHAFRSSFYETWNVSHNVTFVLIRDNTQDRINRRKMIICNLWLCVRCSGQKC